MERMPAHAMTCDVEDYFQVSAFEGVVPRQRWSELACRIPRNVDTALQILSESESKATFFTLGWVAKNYPEVVRRITDEGHEIASHGMEHRRVWTQQPKEFFEDASTAKKILEDISGHAVKGYRAASWSIDERTPWAHDQLAAAGYVYSSSIYPSHYADFGMPGSPVEPYRISGSGLLEVPASVISVLGRNLPASGGGYFRLYPLWFSMWLIDKMEAENKNPYLFYFHPWELDPDQPRLKGVSVRGRIKHYLNLRRFEGRLRRLLVRYRWDRMDRIFLPFGADADSGKREGLS